MDEGLQRLRMIIRTLPLLLVFFSRELAAQEDPTSLFRNHTTFARNSEREVAEGMVLLVNAPRRIGCGFLTVQCPSNSQKCFVLAVSYLGPDGGFLPEQFVWTANGNNPVPAGSRITFTSQGDLLLRDRSNQVIWSTNTSNMGAEKLQLKSSGDLVLLTANRTEIWRSFDYPTDTLLPEQILPLGRKLLAYKPGLHLSSGWYSLVVEKQRVSMYVKYTTGSQRLRYSAWTPTKDGNFSIQCLKFNKDRSNLQLLSSNKTVLHATKVKKQQEKLLFVRLARDGSLNFHFEGDKRIPLNKQRRGTKFQAPVAGECSLPFKCGSYGICSGNFNCSCPSKDFQPAKRSCEPLQALSCSNSSSSNSSSSQRLIRLENVDYFPTQFVAGTEVSSVDECKQSCLSKCSCKVAIFKVVQNRSLCYEFEDVLTLINVSATMVLSPSLAFVKVEIPPSNSSLLSQQQRRRQRTVMWTAISVAIVTVLLVPFAVIYLRRLSKKHSSDEILDSIPGVPRRFTFQELKNASASFSRKLGRGGFGTVYHGVLEDGTKVAIKQLESSRGGRVDQFRAEVVAIGSVHHSNLVKLIGFCCDEHKHTLLVYEYMPHGSLDMWIFAGDNDDKILDWRTRFKVALDIAKGLSYLHEGCDRSILHLDIKPQNILLDVEFKAKISDFGLAIFATEGSDTLRQTALRGTPGYMAPEWLRCQISVMIDVYSFGILLLEIVSGRQALEFLEAIDPHHNLDNESPFRIEPSDLVELLDSRLQGWSYSSCEVERCVLVALCCIQDDPAARPSMGNVVKMLEGNLPVPDALIGQRYLSTAVPLGIASFIASKNSRLSRSGL